MPRDKVRCPACGEELDWMMVHTHLQELVSQIEHQRLLVELTQRLADAEITAELEFIEQCMEKVEPKKVKEPSERIPCVNCGLLIYAGFMKRHYLSGPCKRAKKDRMK